MKEDKITSFQMKICNSSLYNLDYALVYPTDVMDNADDKLADAFIKYHLAIKPGVPVIIFQLSTLAGVGSQVYRGTCETVYHIPPGSYQSIEDIYKEGTFCTSLSYLEYVLKAKALNRSIFTLLEPVHKEQGLNVLGIECNANSEA